MSGVMVETVTQRPRDVLTLMVSAVAGMDMSVADSSTDNCTGMINLDI